MQVPSTLDGLRNALRVLGFGDIVTGLESIDLESAKQVLLDQLDFMFEESQQTLQDQNRYRKARSLVERFQPTVSASSAALASAINALKELRALLRHDIPAPEGAEMEALDFEVEDEDEDGVPTSVRVTRESDDGDEDCDCGCGGSCGCS
jgi:hypothetical protein